MIIGNSVMVEDKGGLTAKDKVNESSNHPEYEYRMVSLSMSSNNAAAITRRDISIHIFDGEPLTRGGRTHYKSMFEKDLSENRYIKANINMDSVSDNIFCLSATDSGMLPVRPSQIMISIREIRGGKSPETYCGKFYFNDENEEREYSFKKGDNSLFIYLNLDSSIFSDIFNSLKNGDTTIEFEINFPAYADWLDWMAGGGGWPTTYIINPARDDENFISITSISTSQSANWRVEDEETEVIKNDDTCNYENDIEHKDVNASIIATNELISNHSIHTKRLTSYLAIITFCLIILTIKVCF
ncbi:hypothetical protein FQG50_03570 [Escherichia coli]|uniref:hypothetical protein n=1 Tax=Escherichia coli TaxID=562 RepID=UPI000BE50BFF|nr:hypothetical protein [Escherichia coli]EEZ7153370.1 hypothetical protein [Escherichia coli]EFH4726770.1 hypothetical protein [Escherichia coli]EFN4969669.1 hypothetical protein [Escherichia coli]EHS6039957.1 hypothetical protein [Escherichia coli]EJD5583299.1 hypothetical protein [Escherichia coli]